MSEKAKFRYLIIKQIIFTILAVLVFIFRETLVEENVLKIAIGSLMILYGVEEILFEILEDGKKFIHKSKTFLGLIELGFGIILLASPIAYEHVCIIWATWSIIRESYEIREIVTELKAIVPCIISGLESVAVIVFSVMLILEPGEHHALIHMYLLVVELVLSPLIVLLDEIIQAHKEKKNDAIEEKAE